jgi:hypothetical protein
MKRFTLGKKNGRIKKTSQPAVEDTHRWTLVS